MDVHCLETELDVNIFFPSYCKKLQSDYAEKQNKVLQTLENALKTTNIPNNISIVVWKLAEKLENAVLSSHTKKRNVAYQRSVVVPLCMTLDVFVRLLNCIMTAVITTQNNLLAEKMMKLCTSLLLSHKIFPKSTLFRDNVDVKEENTSNSNSKVQIISRFDIKRQSPTIKQYKYTQTLLGILMAKSILTHCLAQTSDSTTIHESELIYLLSIVTSLLCIERNKEHVVEILDLLVCCANRMVKNSSGGNNSENHNCSNNIDRSQQTQTQKSSTFCIEIIQSFDCAIAHVLSTYNNHAIYNHFNCLPSFLVDTTVPTSNNNFYNATNKVMPAPRVSNSNDFVWEIAGIADTMMSIVVDENMSAKLKCKEIKNTLEIFNKTSYLHTLRKFSTNCSEVNSSGDNSDSFNNSSGNTSGNNNGFHSEKSDTINDCALFRISIPNNTTNQTNNSTTSNNSHTNNDIVLSNLILYHYITSSTDALVHEDDSKNMEEEEECVSLTDIDILMRLALECTVVVAILAAHLQATVSTVAARLKTVTINSTDGNRNHRGDSSSEKRFEQSLLFLRILCQVNNTRHYLRLMAAHNSLEYVPHYAHILNTIDTQLNNMLGGIDHSVVCETLGILTDKHNVFTNSDSHDSQLRHSKHENQHTAELYLEQEYNSRDGILSRVPSGLLTDAGLCVVSQFVARNIENGFDSDNSNSTDAICKLLCYLPFLLRLTADCDISGSSAENRRYSGNSSSNVDGIDNSVPLTVFTDFAGNSLSNNVPAYKLLIIMLLELFRTVIDAASAESDGDSRSELINIIANAVTNSVDNTNNSVKLYNILQQLIVQQSDSLIISAIVSVLNALVSCTQVTKVRNNTIYSTEHSRCEYSVLHNKHLSLLWRLINTSSIIVSSNIVFRSVYDVGTDPVVIHLVSRGHYNNIFDSLICKLQKFKSCGDSNVQVENTLQLLIKLFKTDTYDECNNISKNNNSNSNGNIDITMFLWLSFMTQNKAIDSIYMLSYIIKQVFNFLYRVKIKQQLVNHETMSAIHELQSRKPLIRHHNNENETTDQFGTIHPHKSPQKLGISPALSPYHTTLNTLNALKSPQETPPKRVKSQESKQFSYVNDVADKYAQKIGVKIADELPPQNSITNNPAALALLLSQIGAKPLNSNVNNSSNSGGNSGSTYKNNNSVNDNSSNVGAVNLQHNTPNKNNTKSHSNRAAQTPINTSNSINITNTTPNNTTNITINTPTQFGNSERRIAAVISSVEKRIIQNNKRKITSPAAEQFNSPFNIANNSANSLNIPAIDTTSSTYRLQTDKNLQFSPIYDKKSRDFYLEFCLSLLPAVCLLALSDIIIAENNTGDSNNDNNNNDDLVSCNDSCNVSGSSGSNNSSGSDSKNSSSSSNSDRNSGIINQKSTTSGNIIDLTSNNSGNCHTNNNHNNSSGNSRNIFNTTRYHSIVSVYSILIYTLNEQIYIIQNNRKLHSFVVSIVSETLNCCFAMLECISVCINQTITPETKNHIEKIRNYKNNNNSNANVINNTSRTNNTDILNNDTVSLISWSLTLLDAINRYCSIFTAVIVQCDVFTVTKAQITAVSKLEKESKLQFDSINSRFESSDKQQYNRQQNKSSSISTNSITNNSIASSNIGIIRNATSNYMKYQQLLSGGSVSSSPATALPHNSGNNSKNNGGNNWNSSSDIPSAWDDNLVAQYIKCVEKLFSSEKLVSGNNVTSDQCRNSEVNCSGNNSGGHSAINNIYSSNNVANPNTDINSYLNHNTNNSTISSNCPSLIANKAPTPPVYCELVSDNSSLTDTASFTDLSLATESNLNSAFESEHKYW